jgi:hypothetical protein
LFLQVDGNPSECEQGNKANECFLAGATLQNSFFFEVTKCQCPTNHGAAVGLRRNLSKAALVIANAAA